MMRKCVVALLREPLLCSRCGEQIDRAEKYWTLKNGSFQRNACHEFVLAMYLGGFAGVTKQNIAVDMRFKATQVNVETSAVLGKNRKVLWTMPYNKIRETRIDTAENLTAARLLLTGIFAFGLKKKHRYLVVSFEDEYGMVQNPVFEGLALSPISAAQKAIYQRVGVARAPAAAA